MAGASLGAVLVLLATAKYGIAAISDSAAYIAAARNVAEGHGFTGWNGDPYVMWPPLYPALLASLEVGGVDTLGAARWLNAALHAGLGLVAGLTLRRLTGDKLIPPVVAFAVVVAPSLLDDAIAVMSEPLFILLALSSLVVLARHLHGPDTRTLIAAAVLAALAWLTRYAGFALVATACLLLLARRGRPFRRSLTEATVFGVVASAPTALWLIRNYLVSGTITGDRHESPHSIGYFAASALQRIGEWFLPPRLGAQGAVIVGAALLGAVAAVLVTSAIRTFGESNSRPRWWEASAEGAAVVFASFTLIYVASVSWLLSVSFATDDPRRILTPALPAALMVLGLFATKTMPQGKQWQWPVGALLAGLLAVWPSRYALGLVHYAREHGAGGVASDRWQRSGTITHLKSRAANLREHRAVIYSNEPTAIYLLTGLRSVFWLPPHDNPYSPLPPRESLDAFARRLPRHEPTYVALFDAVLEDYTYPRPLFETMLPVELVHVANDGALYRVKFPSAGPGVATSQPR